MLIFLFGRIALTLKSTIASGDGAEDAVAVKDSALVITQFGCPPMIPQKNKIFRQYFTDDGTSSGSNDMLVDGSSVPVEFWIPAHEDNDRYITKVSFLIADDSAALDEFGHITALTNGCEFEYDRGYEIVTIHDALKTNFDFIRLCMGMPAFGDGTSVFIAPDISGKIEGVIPVFNFLEVMPPYGLKLDAGTTQRLTIKVNDDLSAPDAFNAIAYGFDRFE